MPVEMTRQEFYDKYGDVVVKFKRYYKYTFTFEGTLPDGKVIQVGYGGSSDEIYRYELLADKEATVENIWPYRGSVYDNGVEVEVFYDF